MILNYGAGEDSWESLKLQEIKPVNPKGNQAWIFTGSSNAEADAPILWPSDVKCWLIRKDPDAEKNWRQKEKETTEDEMVGWHHQLNKHDLGQTLGDGEGQRSLVWCSPWGYRVRHNFQQHDLIGLSRVANIVFHSHVYLHLQMMFLRQYLSSVEESGMIN